MARYELLERIGVGGMAEIFRGVAVAGGGFEKPVAIKRILPHLSQDQRFVELLISEAKTLSELRHRNIVQIYDVGLGDDGQYFLVMEFVDGLDLRALYESLERQTARIPLEVALYVCAEVCEALDHAHRARAEDGSPLGLVHRDVSPSNVMLSRSGEVKLTDFGIAKRMEEATGHGGVRGKFAYISPEQAHNAHVDARSDVYSVGILLFELTLGRRLFSGLPDFDALKAVRTNQVPRPRDVDPKVDPHLEALLLQALCADPGQRFDSAGRFGAELRGFRYSLDSRIADPASEIASLIAGYQQEEETDDHEPAQEFEQERTVVRIDTAAGFTLSGIQLLGSLGSQVPAAAADDDDDEVEDDHGVHDETTRAMSIEQLADAMGTESGPTRTVNLRSAAVGEDTSARTRIARFDSATQERDTELLDGDPATLEPEDEPGSGDHEATSAWPLPEHSAAAATAPAAIPSLSTATARPGGSPPLSRAATPTVREVFHAGKMAGPGMPGVGAERRPAPMSLPPRQRNAVLVGGAVLVLALVGFLIAGKLLADDQPAASAPVAPDAAPADAGGMDAGEATMVMPPDEVEVSDERSKRRERRKRAKRRRQQRNR